MVLYWVMFHLLLEFTPIKSRCIPGTSHPRTNHPVISLHLSSYNLSSLVLLLLSSVSTHSWVSSFIINFNIIWLDNKSRQYYVVSKLFVILLFGYWSKIFMLIKLWKNNLKFISRIIIDYQPSISTSLLQTSWIFDFKTLIL